MYVLRKQLAFFLLIIGILLLSVISSFSQKLGQWTSFLPYQSGLSITQSKENIYYSTEWSLLKIDKEDFSSERISKVNGLNDIGIGDIGYDIALDQLVVAYTNGNIDIIREDNVINLPNIKLNNDLIGSKSINDIEFDKSTIYLSTGFGLVQIDSESLLFKSTTFTGVSINATTIIDNQVFISTPEGIYTILNDGSLNVTDFSLWQFLGTQYGLSELYNSRDVARFDNSLFFDVNGDLFRLQSDTAQLVWSLPSVEIGFISSSDDYLVFSIVGSDGRGDVLFYDGQSFIQNQQGCSDVVRDAIIDERGRVWYADEYQDFRTSENIDQGCTRIQIDSPNSHEVSEIFIGEDRILVSSGGVRDNFDYRFTKSGFYVLDGNDWININENSESFIRENDLQNFLTIASHPSNQEVYAGTYWGGLLQYNLETKESTLYNDTNSGLLGTIGDSQRERVTDLHFDDDNDLWITTFGSARPLVLLANDGSWYNFSLGSNNNLIKIAQDNFGYLWIPAFGNNGGVYVYDPGEDQSSSQDDRIRYITSANSSITTNIVNDVKVDLEGSVWIGTGEGPVIFDCGIDPFDASFCQGNRIKVVQDSIVAFLLADQDILSIEIDGANQKWLGTRNGIFVQSPDGEEMIQNYNESNSPLFDNRIRDLSYDDSSGMMYIGSDRGIQTIQTFTLGAQAFHSKSNIQAFPNPVLPSYTGPIAIRGLRRDVRVQITDVNANLVAEMRSFGGQAVWDGTDFSKRRVKSGVYLVFISDDNSFDRPDAFVTKLMIIR